MIFIVLQISKMENENSHGFNHTRFLKFLLKIESENSTLFSKNIFLENEKSFPQPNAPLGCNVNPRVFPHRNFLSPFHSQS